MKARTLLVVLLMLISIMHALPATAAAPATRDKAPMSSVPRPEGIGPFPVGTFTDTVSPKTKTYSVNVMLFYPALANGSGTTSNKSKAPYPTIIFLPFFGGNEVAMAGLAQQISSWGLVVMTVAVNWSDFPYASNRSDMEDYLDYLENQNTTLASHLYQMVDKEAFGLSGYSSGGGITLMDAAFVPRIRAVETMAAAIDEGSVDYIAPFFHKPLLLQVGKEDSTYRGGSVEAYKMIGAPISLVDIIGGNHGGPFEYELFPAFYLYQFHREPGYFTYLYGEEAVTDDMIGTYDLSFNVSPTHFFPPRAMATASKASANMDEPLAFNASLIGYWPKGLPQNRFQWDIDGDGNADYTDNLSMNGTLAYTAPGQFTPRFTYGAGIFKVSAVAAPVTVKNVPPVAEAGYDIVVNEEQMAFFDGSMSNDTASDVLTFRWAFGDGGARDFDADPTAYRSYKKMGVYNATLTVKDRYGATATDKLKVIVKNLAPKAEAGPSLSGLEDRPVDFVGNGTDTPTDLPALMFRWDFGDGNGTDWGQVQTASHAYTRMGNYTAVLSVKDDNGAIANDTVRVEIYDLAPLATLKAPENGTQVDEDTEVELQGLGQDTVSDQAGLLYMWDLGDGNTTLWGPATNTTHIYTAPGRFRITLWVKDDDGVSANDTTNIIVHDPAPEARILSPTAGLRVAEDQNVSFEGDGLDNPSDLSGLTYEWTIDGKVFETKAVQYRFTRTGTYGISLKVTDPYGSSDNATVEVSVTDPAPTLTSVVVEPLKFRAGGYINFSAEGNDTPSDKANLTYEWTFGDGLSSNESSGVHTYGIAGTYPVKVVVTDDEGASVSMTFTIVVEARPIPKPVDNGEKGPGIMVYAAISAAIVVLAIVAVYILIGLRKRPGAAQEDEGDLEEQRTEIKEMPKAKKVKKKEQDEGSIT